MDRVWLGIAGNSTTNVSPKDRMEIWVAEHRIPPNPEGKLAPYGYIKYLPGWFAPSPDGPIPDNPAAPTAVQQNPWSAR